MTRDASRLRRSHRQWLLLCSVPLVWRHRIDVVERRATTRSVCWVRLMQGDQAAVSSLGGVEVPPRVPGTRMDVPHARQRTILPRAAGGTPSTVRQLRFGHIIRMTPRGCGLLGVPAT